MKKFLLAAVLVPSILHAQRWHVNAFGGFSNYSGDLQDKFFTLDQSYASFGLGLQYDLTPNLSVIGNGNYAHIGASDAFNKPSLQPRNLSFQSRILELNLLFEYNFMDIRKSQFTPYVFAGLAVYHFNPYAYDTAGNKIYLAMLSTEGQGLPQYPDVKPYSLTQIAIPFGAGIKFRITDGVILAYEFNFRKLFTDYLDDVSNRYVDPNILLNARGPKAVEMAYRGGELKGGNPTYPPVGALRGSPTKKDWYYTSGIKISIAINARRDPYYGRGSIACPPKM